MTNPGQDTSDGRGNDDLGRDDVGASKEAYDVARWNPGYAIEGWLAGYESIGDGRAVGVMRRALEIQAEWRAATPWVPS